jgi:hypothetical protein
MKEKTKQQKTALGWGYSSLGWHLSSMYKALDSIPSTGRKQKTKQKQKKPLYPRDLHCKKC